MFRNAKENSQTLSFLKYYIFRHRLLNKDKIITYLMKLKDKNIEIIADSCLT